MHAQAQAQRHKTHTEAQAQRHTRHAEVGAYSRHTRQEQRGDHGRSSRPKLAAPDRIVGQATVGALAGRAAPEPKPDPKSEPTGSEPEPRPEPGTETETGTARTRARTYRSPFSERAAPGGAVDFARAWWPHGWRGHAGTLAAGCRSRRSLGSGAIGSCPRRPQSSAGGGLQVVRGRSITARTLGDYRCPTGGWIPSRLHPNVRPGVVPVREALRSHGGALGS